MSKVETFVLVVAPMAVVIDDDDETNEAGSLPKI